ncbi:MAG: S-layer homology domain-containing protein [Clostridia bacterium]|nr:S-layer homology domain-containing protein [Clostridia bacterium]
MKKGIVLLLCVCMLFGGIGCAPTTDAAEDTSAIILQKIGIMKGTENGLETERNVTRAEALALIYRICGIAAEQQAGTTFADIDGHWAYETIADAYKKGYVAGISETEFAPERTVTGREFVKMLLSVLGYDGITIENAYDKGIELSLLLHKDTKEAVHKDAVLTRGIVATICHSALFVKTPEGQLVKQMLVEKGLYTQEDFGALGCGTPAAAADFSDKLYAQMPQEKNFMFSPLSIKMAFALAANGAEAETKQELLNALDIADLDAYNTYATTLVEKYNAAGVMEFNLANALWVNESKTPAKLQSAYAQKMRDFYAAEINTVTDADAVAKINGWVKEQTKGKIPAIVQNSDFLAALVNAVYFKAAWKNEFHEAATTKDTFHNADGTTAETDFMHQTDYFKYGEVGSTRILELPYKNYVEKADAAGNYSGTERFDDLDVSMYILMGETQVHNPQAVLDDATLARARVKLAMPKFESSFEVGLNDIMRALGAVRAFDVNRAQISGILENQPLYIQSSLHKSYIKVDEKGTEAAAVTGIMVGATSAPPAEPIEFKADKPFTYIIRDNTNGEILFMGAFVQAK